MEEFPLYSPFSKKYQISSHEILKLHDRKSENCQICNKTRKFYCYNCAVPSSYLISQLPYVKLPFRIIVWKHPGEHGSKSTGIHAKIMSPEMVKVLNVHPKEISKALSDSNDMFDLNKTIVLFPSNDAHTLSSILSHTDNSYEIKNNIPFDTLIVLEGTWRQAKAMNQSLVLGSLPRVKLSDGIETHFWRYQRLGSHCLSTIEAIHAFLGEYASITCSDKVYDNLLYFYSYLYHKIQDSYRNHPDKKFNSRHVKEYIYYDE